jgi:predicted transcriptional regulator
VDALVILDAGAGTTLPDVPDPTRERRRRRVRELREQGYTYDEIADELDITKSTVQDDLNPDRRPPPRSIRLPDEVDDALVKRAAGEGVPVAQVMIRAIRSWLGMDQP